MSIGPFRRMGGLNLPPAKLPPGARVRFNLNCNKCCKVEGCRTAAQWGHAGMCQSHKSLFDRNGYETDDNVIFRDEIAAEEAAESASVNAMVLRGERVNYKNGQGLVLQGRGLFSETERTKFC